MKIERVGDCKQGVMVSWPQQEKYFNLLKLAVT